MIFKIVFTILWLTSFAIAGSQERVEILISDSSTAAFESFFGHNSILIIPEGKTWDEGTVYSFVAKVDDSDKSSSMKYVGKGLTGGFPLIVMSEPALSFFHTKVVYERRDIQRLILPLTQAQKIKLKASLEDFQKHPEKLGNYYFHIKNCASMVFFLLKHSGVQVKYNELVLTSIQSGIVPNHLEEYSRSSLLFPLPGDTVLSTETLLSRLEKKYDLKIESRFDKKTKEFLQWDRKDENVLAAMTLEELILASQGLAMLDSVRSSYLQDLIKLKKKRVKVNFVQMKEFPDSFYTICEERDKACQQRLQKDIQATYELKVLKRVYRIDSLAMAEAISYHPEFNYDTSEQSRHWQQVVSALKEILQD